MATSITSIWKFAVGRFVVALANAPPSKAALASSNGYSSGGQLSISKASRANGTKLAKRAEISANSGGIVAPLRHRVSNLTHLWLVLLTVSATAGRSHLSHLLL
jgi:hypothetical protein